jgi:hypothetical protein
MESLPHGMESFFEGEALMASLHDEFTHDIECFGIPSFKPFRIMQDKESILV